MKLMWFHLMPYTELPDDFRDKNPSVWVDIHFSDWEDRWWPQPMDRSARAPLRGLQPTAPAAE